MEEDTDKQSKNSRVAPLLPYQWKKGQSGNIMGRPKGKTMKEYAKEYLERMTDEERDEWLEGIDKHKIWEMSEGKARQETDIAIKEMPIIQIAEAIANKNDTARVPEQNS